MLPHHCKIIKTIIHGSTYSLCNETWKNWHHIQYIPRNMHTVFALLCFVVVIHWLIFPYPSGILHWHCGNLTIAPVPAKQPWWIWINTSCEFIMNDYITTTKQSTTKPCAFFLGYTVRIVHNLLNSLTPTLLWLKCVHRNHGASIGYYDVRVASSRLMYRWLQCHCDKKVCIETTYEQSFIGSPGLMYLWRHNRLTTVFLNIIGTR